MPAAAGTDARAGTALLPAASSAPAGAAAAAFGTPVLLACMREWRLHAPGALPVAAATPLELGLSGDEESIVISESPQSSSAPGLPLGPPSLRVLVRRASEDKNDSEDIIMAVRLGVTGAGPGPGTGSSPGAGSPTGARMDDVQAGLSATGNVGDAVTAVVPVTITEC